MGPTERRATNEAMNGRPHRGNHGKLSPICTPAKKEKKKKKKRMHSRINSLLVGHMPPTHPMWCVNTSYCLQLSTAQTPFRSWPTGWITIHNSSCKFEQRFAGNFADCVVVDSKLPDQVAFGPSTIYTSSFITKPNLAQHIEARAGEKKPRDRRRSVGFWTDQTRPSGYVNPVGSEVASLTMHVNKTKLDWRTQLSRRACFVCRRSDRSCLIGA
jgi:hypothetical protein